jgi:3-oxoacyl-[acyl-carrier-protein] synthase-3
LSTRARISGVGKYLPERVLSNADLEQMVDTSDEWIRDRTGIRERHRAAPHETASSMGIEAGRQALAQAGLEPGDLDLVIAATTSPDGMFPSVASLIQGGIGAERAGAFDINAACVGFLTALATASQFIQGGVYRRILVVGSDVLSRIVDWDDRTTCVLFADGAGAVVVEASEGDRGGPLAFVLRSDGTGAPILNAPGPCSAEGATEPGKYYIHMDGTQVFKFAVHAMESATREAVAAAGLTIGDIDLLIPHQANLRIINATAKALGLPADRAMVNLDRYGNTSSASIPMALQEACEAGRLKEGDHVVLVAFGGGLVWGAMVLEWTPVGPVPSIAKPAHAAAGGS